MRKLILFAALGGLSACQSTAPDDTAFTSVIEPVTHTGAAGVQVTRGFGPPDANPESCYGREIEPAVIETVTEQIMVEPEQLDRNGEVRRPAVFVTSTEQRIVEDRTETWFETPCAMQAADPTYISTLQRALEARGHYSGPITGTLDRATIDGVRAYQAPQGLDSGVLSLAAARQLGLSVWDPELAGRGGSE
ncbi:peptidoglycan-binding protein [Rhodobacterales bacterium HKCCE4037]|nr:peptidoglycan-binding protein [Rhodobacterales bacterium HKCCE4037]